MWSRKDLKQKGKWAFKKNYWKTVLVSLLFILLVGGGTVSFNFSDNFTQGFKEGFEEGIREEQGKELSGKDVEKIIDKSVNKLIKENKIDTKKVVIVIIVTIIVVLIVAVIIIAIVAVIDAFLVNPIDVGAKGFFLKNLNTNANAKEMLSAFDTQHYKNIVKIMFVRDVKIVLWSLLLIIPGIVKAYEYSMIPYLLAENPDMQKEIVFEESKRMMNKNKWRAFVLDLSFIGWYLLSVLTIGILNIFYVTPYVNSTKAVLYETLRYGNGNVVNVQFGEQEIQ